MKKKYLVVIFLFATLFIQAQNTVPQGINYQAIARNSAGSVYPNQAVNVRLTILEGGTSGIPVFSENHSTTTNAFGLFNLKIGSGSPINGTFTSINWSTANHFLKVEIDINGGNIFTDIGTLELLSVPYALYAETAGNTGGIPGPAGPVGPQGSVGPQGPTGPPGGGAGNLSFKGKNASSNIILSVANPTQILNDLTENITTGATNPKVKISGVVSAAAGTFTYENLNQVSLGILNIYLERATDAGFTQNLVSLQNTLSTMAIKIPDAYTNAPLTRTIIASIGGSTPIEYFDNTVNPNTTYYYRLKAEREIAGQQPSEFNIVIFDRSLSFIVIAD